MSDTSAKLTRALALVAFGLALSSAGGPAQAGQIPSTAKIIRALTPRPLTRSLSAPDDMAHTSQGATFIDSVRDKPAADMSARDRDKLNVIARNKPNFDLEIDFNFNSALIRKSAKPIAIHLGKALTNRKLRGNTFVIAGYADAKGRAAYNQRLSERRAESVKDFLVNTFKVPARDLVTVGYGSTHLKDPKHPYAAENRRVRIVNLGGKELADK